MKAALSIQASAVPPNRVPRWLVWSGKTISSSRASVLGAWGVGDMVPRSACTGRAEVRVDRLRDLRRGLEAGQASGLAAVAVQRQRRGLAQAEAAEEVVAHGFHLHLQQDQALGGGIGG